jgi:hypothetical protein
VLSASADGHIFGTMRALSSVTLITIIGTLSTIDMTGAQRPPSAALQQAMERRIAQVPGAEVAVRSDKIARALIAHVSRLVWTHATAVAAVPR